jgi:hypothetical protein
MNGRSRAKFFDDRVVVKLPWWTYLGESALHDDEAPATLCLSSRTRKIGGVAGGLRAGTAVIIQLLWKLADQSILRRPYEVVAEPTLDHVLDLHLRTAAS